MIQAIQQLQGPALGANKINSSMPLTSDKSFTDSLEAAKKLLEVRMKLKKLPRCIPMIL